jgi:4-carboxymuconolactone decarboxylase
MLNSRARLDVQRLENRMEPKIWGNEPTPDTPTTRAYPADVHRDSSSRLPPVRREDLDEHGRNAYDAVVAPGSKLRASLRGPTGFWLHLPEVIEHVRELNWSLRNNELGLARPLRELTILVAARANDCQKEWTAHEPRARDAGVAPEIIDILKHHKPADGVAEPQAAIIAFGRELFAGKRVSPQTYARALRVLGQRGLVHMIALLSNYTMTAVIFAALDQQVAPDQTPLLPLP